LPTSTEIKAINTHIERRTPVLVLQLGPYYTVGLDTDNNRGVKISTSEAVG